MTKEKIKESFIEYLLMQEHIPTSVFAFCKHLKIKESEFYDHFNSFNALEGVIWNEWFGQTIDTLNKDDAYIQYSVREKLLAFYYTWLEVLKSNRSYVLWKLEKIKPGTMPAFLNKLKSSFEEYIADLIIEGKDTTEIADRPFSNQYNRAFWLQFSFVTKFWSSDDSEGFEQTDAVIEKAVNFMFDLIGRGVVDSFLDLTKFLYQNRRSF